MISNNYANKILNTLLTATSNSDEKLTTPAAVYLGLCYAQPNEATGSLVDAGEPNGVMTSDSTKYYYKRKFVSGTINKGQSNEQKIQLFSPAANGKIANNAEIQMVTAREAYPNDGKINYWFLSTSPNVGDAAFMWGEVKDKEGNLGITVLADTVPTFYEGQLQASIDVPLGTETTEAEA